MRATSAALLAFPEEAKIIGRILLGFTELEYLICCCVGVTLQDANSALRALYRLYGADSRLQVASALLRPPYETVGLKSEYEAAIGAARFSKSIRNQYAHSNWFSDIEHGLTFIDLGHSAKTNIGEISHVRMKIDVPILTLQEKYLNYASEWFYFLWREYEVRAGKKSNHDFPAPKIIDQPPLHKLLD